VVAFVTRVIRIDQENGEGTGGNDQHD
jgi:hypothetical protein